MRLAIVLDSSDAVALVPFWEAALGYEHAGSVPGFEVLLPAGHDDAAPTFLLQHVDAPPAGRGRVHVDVHPPLDLGVQGLVARLDVLDVVADAGHFAPQALGATAP